MAVGLSRLSRGESEVVRLLKGRRVGLLAHPASVDDAFVHAERIVPRSWATLGALFGDDHGYGG